MIRMGILGPGHIAEAMAKTVNAMNAQGDHEVTLYAAASRDEGRARAFADTYGMEQAYGSYEAMLADKKVDLVYVATPHSHHAEQMKQCIAHGKHVLCEKAFTANAAQAEEVLTLAEKAKVLVTEAIWTRYMPSRQIINEVLASGIIGTPITLTASLCYDIERIERIRRPELAGGALLDVGVYVLNFAAMTFGDAVSRMDSSAAMMDTGVDRQESITLHYQDGRMAVLMAGAAMNSDRLCTVYGDKGCIKIENVNNPQRIYVYDKAASDTPVQTLTVPEQLTGYEYEVQACVRAIQAGRVECPEMPHGETVRIMRQMDELRAAWGVKYPFEQGHLF